MNDPSKLWGLIRVTNIGRRPVYISVVALELPKGSSPAYFIIARSIGSSVAVAKLGEGDAPAGYVVNQEDVKPYAEHWKQIRICVEDSAGKKYRSPYVKVQPSWAKPSGD